MQASTPNSKPSLRHQDCAHLVPALPDETFDRLARVSGRALGMPAVLISLFDGVRETVIGMYGLSRGELEPDPAFCAEVLGAGQLLHVPDTAQDARFARHVLVEGPSRLRLYVGVPLLLRGRPVGVLGVLDTAPRLHFPQDAAALLLDLAALVSGELEARERLSFGARGAEHVNDPGVSQHELEQRVDERTQELQQLNARLQHDAMHDALTGMPNRALMLQRLEEAVGRSKQGGPPFALLFLDCDRFKVINDSLGHSVGDQLLIAFGRRLQDLTRPQDTVARLSGDEFTVLLEDVTTPDVALQVAQRLQRALGTPFLVLGHALHLSASVGIVISDPSYTSSDEVMRDADIAMYRAKGSGGGRFAQFDISMREDTLTQMRLESELRAALETDGLGVQYQPIIDLASGEVSGFEALARWHHPQYGQISPAQFIPIAEETGLIVELDRWVLLEACRQMMEWVQSDARFGHLTLNVNMSTRQFVRADFLESVQLIVHSLHFPPQSLRLEITEGLLMERSPQVQRNIEGLRSLGIELHIDDFGTGYSSLSYLQRFRADTLKIDRDFVRSMSESSQSAELVRTMIAMAHALGMTVTAEGVETVDELMFLQALGCEYGQGFLFSRPLPGLAAFELVSERSKEGLRRWGDQPAPGSTA